MYKCKFVIKHYLSEMSSMGFACKFIYSLLAGRLLCLLAESLHVGFYAALTLNWLFLSGHQLKRSMPKNSLVCPRRCVDTVR